MTYLTLLLVTKISATFVAVALPFLLLPQQRLEKLTNLVASSTLFFRLYGVAVLALLVGYGSAIPVIQSGIFPWGIVTMGLISNAGATVFLFKLGHGKQNRIMSIFFGLVALALVSAMIFPTFAISKIW